MGKIKKAADEYANNVPGAMMVEEVIYAKIGFTHGAEYMLDQVIEFMRNFKLGDGTYPLYDYIGNVKNAMLNDE